MTVIEQRFIDAVISISRTLQDQKKDQPKAIDWEQRRYELVKELYAARIGRSANCEKEIELLHQSVEDATVIVAILKSQNEKNPV